MNVAEINASNWMIIKAYMEGVRTRKKRESHNVYEPYFYPYDSLVLLGSERMLKESVQVEYLSPVMRHIYAGLLARMESKE